MKSLFNVALENNDQNAKLKITIYGQNFHIWIMKLEPQLKTYTGEKIKIG